MGELSRFTEEAGGRQGSKTLHPFPGTAGPRLVQNQSHRHITQQFLYKKVEGRKLSTQKNES